MKILRKGLRRILRQVALHTGIVLQRFEYIIAQRSLPKFANDPVDLVISFPRTIGRPERIHIGNGVRLGRGSMLIAMTEYPGVWMHNPEVNVSAQRFGGQIIIGNHVSATAGLQITAFSTITIEDEVMFASNINLTDGLHGYETAEIAYKYQAISRIAPITIKRGCWIGQNVVIMPGVTIGAYSVIGANSVVTKDVPARSIAIGAPATVTKSWSEGAQEWVSQLHAKPSPIFKSA